MPPSPTVWASCNVKEELEDRSLHYLDPVGYEEISKMLSERAAEEFLASSVRCHRAAAEGERHRGCHHQAPRQEHLRHLPQDVSCRTSPSMRSTTSTPCVSFWTRVAECYSALGLIHDMYHPLPNRFKDYISTPKPNVLPVACTPPSSATRASPLRCRSAPGRWMHTAEYGVAAHWKYKAGHRRHSDKLDERLAWVQPAAGKPARQRGRPATCSMT